MSVGGVVLLAMNTNRSSSQSIQLATPSDRYTLSAQNLQDTTVQLNGSEVKLGGNDTMPEFSAAAASGTVTFAPATITFLAIPNANNENCQ
jgi:heparanase 1